MASATSPVTLLRLAVCRLLDPMPAPGLAWCVLCPFLNHPGIAEFPVVEATAHLGRHADEGHGWVSIRYAKRTAPRG